MSIDDPAVRQLVVDLDVIALECARELVPKLQALSSEEIRSTDAPNPLDAAEAASELDLLANISAYQAARRLVMSMDGPSAFAAGVAFAGRLGVHITTLLAQAIVEPPDPV